MQQRRIGAHLSVGKGLVSAAESMVAMGGNALQIFSGSPRGWARKPLEQEKADALISYCQNHDFGPVVLHALYLVNLTGDRDDLIQNSIKSLTYDLHYSAQIHGGGVVVHLGSHLGKGFDSVFDDLISRLKTILDGTPKTSTFLIENSAGQEGKLCSKLEDIRRIFDALPSYVNDGRLRWCFDTCHGFAAGYDLLTIDEEIQRHHLLDALKVIHLNDSRDPFNSGRDRHDNIGEGMIGRGVLQKFLQKPVLSQIPLILEVPGFDGNGPDAKNVEIVKSLL